MFISKRVLAFFTIVLLIFIGGYSLYDFIRRPSFNESFTIHNLAETESFTVFPEKASSDGFLLNVKGYTNGNYILRIDIEYLNPKNIISDSISLAAGEDIHYTIRRDFYAKKGDGKVVVTYIPRNKTASGEIKLGMSIF